jgi:hypothetical protein
MTRRRLRLAVKRNRSAFERRELAFARRVPVDSANCDSYIDVGRGAIRCLEAALPGD